jgi:hypothetical protein
MKAELDAAVKIGQLETQMDNIEKKVDQGFSELKASISALSDKVDVVSELKNDIANIKTNDIVALRTEIALLKKSRGLLNWVVPTIGAAMGSVMTFLVISYLSKH